MGDRLATIDMCQKVCEAAVPLFTLMHDEDAQFLLTLYIYVGN